MLDWMVEEEEANREGGPSQEAVPEPSRARRRPLVLLLVVAGFALLAAFWWRVSDQQQSMKQDLTAFVLMEERARLAGAEGSVDQLVGADVPLWWRTSYRDTFVARRDGQPADFEVREVTLRTDGALVTVRLAHQEQLRYYRMGREGWQRAPIPLKLWTTRETRRGEGRWTLSYYARDAAFADALAADLPALFQHTEQLAGRPVRASILVRPMEHRLYGADPSTLIEITTPELAPLDGRMSGQSRVRLALAEQLLGHTISLPAVEDRKRLPHITSFVNSVQLVVAMQWALDEVERDRVRDGWREQLPNGWRSPFHYYKGGLQQLQADHELSASMHLLVDHLYGTYGFEALAEAMARYPSSRDWDDLFQKTFGRDGVEIERALEAHLSRVPGAVTR